MTPSVPWDGDRDRNRDRLERAAAVGAQTLLRACTAMTFFLLKRKNPMKEMESLKEMVFWEV